MIAANDFNQRSNEICELVAGGNIDRAAMKMMDFARDFSVDKGHVDEVIIIRCNFSQLAASERRGTLNPKEAATERNAVLFRMLGLIRVIEEAVVHGLAA